MALTSKKISKLDTICAKLKQSKQDEEKEEESNDDRPGLPDSVFESPTNLSMKCYNNNIIGKADLNTIEHEFHSNGLDLTKKSYASFNGNKADDDDTNDDKQTEPLDFTGRHRSIERNNKSESEITEVKPVGSSRRKRGIPRSISQVRDLHDQDESKNEVEDINENKRFSLENSYNGGKEESVLNCKRLSGSGDFSNLNDESSSSALNHSKTSNHSKESSKSRQSSELDISDSYSTPLDLSINRSSKYDDDNDDDDDDDSINGYLSSDEDGIDNTVEDDDDDDFFHPDRNLVIDEGKSVSQFSECSTQSSVNLKDGKNIGNEQAAHLKDYAESTMNELISMYGFGGVGSHQNDLSKHVPIKNFTNILQFARREQPSPMGSVGGASLSNHPMSSGDEESHDGSQPMKRLFANTGAGASGKTQGGSKVQSDRFTTSSSFINAVYNTSSGPVQNQLSPGLPNYSKYLKRYNNGTECGGQHCKDLGYREHYHCIDCSFQVFIKKEEMVRHYKWHRKREESLQHGFLRFSPVDNCSKRFGSCTHNGKQTHYHCLQNGCDKVYISTSDVQMHANYHRKDSAIMSEGFQRFRATEDCGTMSCAFYGQRTTHFHCLRPECKFTFKNKADMEKHKSYHQKDEVLGRDGFKKFMKYEHCMYSRCRYSKVSNHIHCIRNGCDYVLHSTAQLYSHKRKHERRDFESAYKHYRDTSQVSPQSGRPGEKLILPRPDMSQVQQLVNMSGNQLAQTLANISNMSSNLKRQLDWDQPEPLELKKPKVEPDSEFESSLQSAPSARSTSDGRDSAKMETEEQSMDENLSSCQEDSKDSSPDFKPHFGQVFKDGDGLNLSGSLNLPIPKFLIKSEPSTPTSVSSNSSMSNLKNIQPKPIEMSSKAESMFSVFGSLAGSMPSTLTGSLLAMNPGTMLTVPSTFPGPSTVLQPPKSVYTERREKDDSWKTYLVRYTANDPCNPHCQYLYKDHYHCKMQGCLVLFKSKDGVREHARFHELQERITPIAYQTYEDMEACPQDCQYSKKEKHFHCIWTGCTHVVPYKGPTFGRLEHYRIHEYARAAAGKSYPRSGKGMPSIEDSSMRRRGRPPKYPKIDIPKIPKVELTDEEIRQSHLIVEEPEETSQMKVINGFRVFTPEDPCPDEMCSFYGKLHYHCARPRCFTITDRIDVLNLHAKDFHSFVKILEGYEFFDRNVSCRRSHCTNKLTNRHFHCARPKCDYSFIRHSTMAQHEKKHQYIPSSPSFHFTTKDVPISPKPFHGDSPLNSTAASLVSQSPSPMGVATSVITSAGAYLPMKQTTSSGTPIYISQPGTLSQGPVILTQQPVTLGGVPIGLTQSPIHVSTVPLPISTIQALPASITAPRLLTGLPSPIVSIGGAPITVGNLDNSADSPSIPLTVLLQRGVNQIPQPSWMDLKAKMHYAISQNCGRPFCKLKKKDHFHCYDCNQAFSDPARLRSHIGKHGLKLKRAEQTLVHNVIAPKVPIQNLNAINMSNSFTSINSNNNNKHVDEELDPDEAQCLSNKAEDENESEVEDTKSSSLNLNPSAFSEMISKAQEQNQMSSSAESDDENSLHIDVDDSGNQSDSNDQKVDVSSRSGRKIIKTKKEGFVNSGDINLSKKNQSALPNNVNTKPSPKKSATKVAAAGSRGLRDDSIPEGYSRWRYNEECKYPKCAYRHSVTHFHCVRDDCGYGFSDRSRLVQHTLRHERIDSITGGELQQYRINQDCEMADCEYNKKMSHFHCKRCVYSCTDSSKVLTHRKYHAKMDNISDQGFEKYFAVDDCNVNLCPYARKQNHFHCVEESCRAAVLGPIQMASHKVKHGSMVKLQILENS